MWGASKKKSQRIRALAFLSVCAFRLVNTHARANKQAYLIVAPATPACVAECGGGQKTYLIAKRQVQLPGDDLSSLKFSRVPQADGRSVP